MGKKIARESRQKLRCSLMPGECFNSRNAAEEMRVTRQINVATGGMGQAVYHVKKCACGRFHLMTDEHLKKWEANRRTTRRERGNNA